MGHQQYDIQTIAQIVRGKLLNVGKAIEVSQLLFDSRKLNDPEQTLFFAIKGKRHDGHKFIHELYKKGVRAFVVTYLPEEVDIPEANIIEVQDAVLAMQTLTAHHRLQFDFPVIGITGSNGKTIVKEWLNQLLAPDFNIIRSPASYNSQIGVPLSVWKMDDSHGLGIFEAGISEPGEMEQLEKVIRPNIGIFTNIGDAHQEGFLNRRHKVKEKLNLFIHSDLLIFCKDYPEINQSIIEFKAQFAGDEDGEKFDLFTWSRQSPDADLAITSVEKAAGQALITATFRGDELSITIPFSDEASIENAIHCWALMLYLGIAQNTINLRMLSLGKVAMRLELKDAINSCSLINDSYNSDLGSLNIALDFLEQQHQHPKKTIILSDILQSGRTEAELYEDVAKLLEQKQINRLVGVGPAMKRSQYNFNNSDKLETAFFKDTDDLIAHLDELEFNHETILLKGARQFRFEQVSKLLEQKVHETVLEINLNALVNNLQVYHQQLQPGTKIMAMVKAFSYGSGSFELANILQFHRVDYLAVAYADEGVALRKAGIKLPIMVMNPEPGSFNAIVNNQLEPEVYSLWQLEQLLEQVGDKELKVHIELDTGMHRLGFLEDDIPELIQRIKKAEGLTVASVFSHLASSEASEDDDFTRQQIRVFDELSQQITRAFNYPILRHIANSAGISRFPDAHFDMVRLGLGLYGIDLTGRLQNKLQTVGTLRSTVSQLKHVPKGGTVGYNRAGKADKDTTIAIVGIGYADGIDRRLSRGVGSMHVRGQLCPIIGNVCMDMCMLDVTGVKNIQEGDEVVVFGDKPHIQQVAEWNGTIPYEVLTGVSGRVKRVYYQE